LTQILPLFIKKVLKCERVEKAIKDAAQEEFNQLQEEAGIEPKTDVVEQFNNKYSVSLAYMV
jgi:hypothetical protein